MGFERRLVFLWNMKIVVRGKVPSTLGIEINFHPKNREKLSISLRNFRKSTKQPFWSSPNKYVLDGKN